MKTNTKKIELGIGFVTGRKNACRVINKYYKNILEQTKRYNKPVNITFFILYDEEYQNTPKQDFYKILPEVYKEIHVKYITPENIQEDKKILKGRYDFTNKQANYILGHGHAKGRNTIMYNAIKRNIDYLLFWDDDEYPVACVKEEEEIKWIKQDNILKHLENIEKADVSVGFHCGYISPIPYLELNEEIDEIIFKKYIEAISNEIIEWDNIKKIMRENNGVTYADEEIINNGKTKEIQITNGGKWVAGSTLCINLRHLDKIPAFYNPPEARGEDTFFSMSLQNSKVIRVPVYHFHDGFLKYTSIMEEKYPKKLRRIQRKEEMVGTRFLKASLGWLRYKPLLLYIKDKKGYKQEISNIRQNLQESVPVIIKLYNEEGFNKLFDVLDEYDKNVQKHYKEFIEANEVWNKIKQNLKMK